MSDSKKLIQLRLDPTKDTDMYIISILDLIHDEGYKTKSFICNAIMDEFLKEKYKHLRKDGSDGQKER